MLNEERRRGILELLQLDGRVLVRDLSDRFHTSLITIRKDLEFLHHQGQLERTHGGSLPRRTGALQDRSFQEKERLHRHDKLRIATAAVRMIREGQVIILDSGTTATAIRSRLQTIPQPYRYNERDKYRRGTGRQLCGSDPHWRHPSQRFLFARGTIGGRILAAT
jgi:DeoR family transcriptional regulator of aga operon